MRNQTQNRKPVIMLVTRDSRLTRYYSIKSEDVKKCNPLILSYKSKVFDLLNLNLINRR